MTEAVRIACDQAEIVVDCRAAADALGARVAPSLEADPWEAATEWLAQSSVVGIALAGTPAPARLIALASAARAKGARVCVALLGADRALVELASDLGLVAVEEVRPLLGAMALFSAGISSPWRASTRSLSDADRARLDGAAGQSGRSTAQVLRDDGGALAVRDGEALARIGEPRDAREALLALRAADGPVARPGSILEGVDARAALEVIFGPPRSLSDPASKAALVPYGVPMPTEELCTSPSRAAAEGSRIGFPVRIALASPDLRVWDHPDLAVDGVESAARARDVYRQLMTLARQRAPSARLLGVTVTATAAARALLSFVATPASGGLVLGELGFADPHGLASGDRTRTALPAPIGRIERVLARLAGSSLLLRGGAGERRATVEAVADVLLRVAAFVDDRRREVERVEIAPLAVLVGGGAEVREACVTVGDAFLRSLDAEATG
jgi:hypothetical protein